MPTTTPEQKVADAIREVTAKIQKAHEASRSRRIDADDLVEALLAIAEAIDPPFPATHEPGCEFCRYIFNRAVEDPFECPYCQAVWQGARCRTHEEA